MMRKKLLFCVPVAISMAFAACKTEYQGPQPVGPEPVPVITFLGRDSISAGDYRGIRISSTSDEAFQVLEGHRKAEKVTYISAVNNFFSDVTDLKNRLASFDWLTLDEKTDTESGIQIELEAGRVKSLTLNNRTPLKQWPQKASASEAIQIGEEPDMLYTKLVNLSTQNDFSHKFQRIVLTAKYTYAVYDPNKAAQPWLVIYKNESPKVTEQARIHFKNKRVQYVIVQRFERQ